MSGRDEYIAEMKLQLDQWKLMLGKRDAKAQQAKDGASDKYKAENEQVASAIATGIDHLDELKAAGKDS
jgi:hypothetical protein